MRTGRLLRSVPVACLLLGLLALVALASRAGHERSSLPSVPAPPAAALDYGLTAAIGAAAVALLFGLTRLRLPEPKRVRSGWQLLWTFVVVGASITIGLLIAHRLHVVEHGGGGAGGGTQHLTEPAGAARERPVAFRWTAAAAVSALLAAAALAYFALRRRRHRPGATAGEPALPAALSEALDESLDDLRREPDARRAVIAAYARAERALERHGLPRRPSEAPLEYLARVLLELRVRAAAVLELTELFERAKFSPHRVDDSMREDAIAALAAVRDDLAGAAA